MRLFVAQKKLVIDNESIYPLCELNWFVDGGLLTIEHIFIKEDDVPYKVLYRKNATDIFDASNASYGSVTDIIQYLDSEKLLLQGRLLEDTFGVNIINDL